MYFMKIQLSLLSTRSSVRVVCWKMDAAKVFDMIVFGAPVAIYAHLMILMEPGPGMD